MKEIIISNEPDIGKKNMEIYKQYLISRTIFNKDTVDTTYRSYFNNMRLFFRFLKNHENNRYILSPDTIKNFTGIWERYVKVCIQRGNNNQTIRNK